MSWLKRKSRCKDELVEDDEEKGEATKQEEGHAFVFTRCLLESSSHGNSRSSCVGLLRRECC